MWECLPCFRRLLVLAGRLGKGKDPWKMPVAALLCPLCVWEGESIREGSSALGSGSSEGSRACERPRGGGDASSRRLVLKGPDKGNNGLRGRAPGQPVLAAEPPPWERRERWSGAACEGLSNPSAPTRA